MKLFLKIVAGIVALLVVAAGAGIVLLKNTDFNQYRGLIAEQVSKATGRQLAIAGDFELAVSLIPTAAVADVTLANAPWGSRPEMVRLKRLEAELELLPLLSGEVRLRRVVLVDADILLETDDKGLGNWVFVKAAGEAAPAGERRLPVVNQVTIEDALVTYRNGVTGKTQSLALDRLAFDAADEASPIALDIEGAVNDNPIAIAGTIGALSTLMSGQPVRLDLAIAAGGAKGTVRGDVARPMQGEGIELAIAVEGDNLAELSALAGGALPPVGPYSLSARLTDPSGAYKLDGVKVRLAGSDLAGEMIVTVEAGRARVSADLTSSSLDLGDFGVEPKGAGPARTDGRVFSDAPLPLAGLGAIDASIKLGARKIVHRAVALDDVALDVALDGGKVALSRFAAGLAGGSFSLSGAVDGSRRPAAINVKLKARGVEAGALLQTLGLSDALAGGKANLDLDVAGRGDSVRQLMAGLGGTVHFDMGSGRIDNDFAKIMLADIFQLVSTGGADISNLNCVVSRFAIKDGVATARGLVIDTPGATILGSGQVNLATERLELRFEPSAKETNLVNLAVPVNLGGTLAAPKASPDAAAVAVGVAGAVVGVATGVGIVGALAGLTAGVEATSDGNPAANPCVAALAADKPAAQQPPAKSTGEKVLDDAGEALDDVGKALKGLFD